jgi:hypothetical protein
MAKTAVRRTIIQEWMLLARDKRRFMGQPTAFARNAAQLRSLSSSWRAPHHGN